MTPGDGPDAKRTEEEEAETQLCKLLSQNQHELPKLRREYHHADRPNGGTRVACISKLGQCQ